MENKVTEATATLRFLTGSIENPKSKPYLREPLQQSLVAVGDYDLATAEAAVTAFFSGPRLVN